MKSKELQAKPMKKDLYNLCINTLNKGKETINYIVQNESIEKYVTPYFENNYSFAYGFSGIVYGLDTLKMKIPDRLLNKCYKDILNKGNITSPYSLTRGKIPALMSINHYEPDKKLEIKIGELLNVELMRSLSNETENFSLFNGLSGIGFLAIEMFKETHSTYFLSLAKMVYNQILKTKPILDNFGLAYGNTGIALFLIHYAEIKKTKNALKYAKFYILYDVKKGKIKNDSNRLRGIADKSGGSIPYIYIPYGTAGILKTIIKYLSLKRDRDLFSELLYLYNSLDIKSTLQSGYLLGTAGVISSLLDLDSIKINNKNVLVTLDTLLESLLSTRICKNDKVLFPADQNLFTAIDYGSGELGILLTINKLVTKREFDPLFQ